MSPTEAAWLAGFFDGEGSLSNYKGGRGGQFRSWIISIVNTDRRALEQCLSFTSVGVVKEKRRRNVPEHWKLSFQWQVTAQREINDVLIQIRPYLTIKREKVDLFLENWCEIGANKGI